MQSLIRHFVADFVLFQKHGGGFPNSVSVRRYSCYQWRLHIGSERVKVINRHQSENLI